MDQPHVGPAETLPTIPSLHHRHGLNHCSFTHRSHFFLSVYFCSLLFKHFLLYFFPQVHARFHYVNTFTNIGAYQHIHWHFKKGYAFKPNAARKNYLLALGSSWSHHQKHISYKYLISSISYPRDVAKLE